MPCCSTIKSLFHFQPSSPLVTPKQREEEQTSKRKLSTMRELLSIQSGASGGAGRRITHVINPNFAMVASECSSSAVEGRRQCCCWPAFLDHFVFVAFGSCFIRWTERYRQYNRKEDFSSKLTLFERRQSSRKRSFFLRYPRIDLHCPFSRVSHRLIRYLTSFDYMESN